MSPNSLKKIVFIEYIPQLAWGKEKKTWAKKEGIISSLFHIKITFFKVPEDPKTPQ